MNTPAPNFQSSIFNSNAFKFNNYLLKTQADVLYISTAYLPSPFGVAQTGKLLSTDSSLSISGLNQIGFISMSYNGTLITSTGTELNYLHGSTPGSATASNALVLDSSRNITNINSISTSAISNSGNLLTGDLSGSTGLIRMSNSAGVAYIQTGTSTSTGSSADLFIGNISQAYNASSRRFMIKAGGNVGIGTYSPQTALSLTGTLRMSESTSGGETIYSELSNIPSSGGCQLKITGFTYAGLALQQSSATANLKTATGIDCGTAYQQRCIALCSTNGGISGSEHYGFGANSSQQLDIMTYGSIRFITGSTPSSIGNFQAVINATGLGVQNTSPACALDCAATIRSTGMGSPSSGAGIELSYASGIGNVLAYDRSGAAYKDLNLNDSIRITSAGRLGVGTSSPACPIEINGSANQTTASGYGYLASSGSGTATGFTNRPFSLKTSSGILVSSGEIDVLSDERTKHNIHALDQNICDRFIEKVKPIAFRYNSGDNREHYGFSAQQLISLGFDRLVGFTGADEPLPEQDIDCEDGSKVHVPSDARLIVSMIDMIPILTQAIQVQQDKLLWQEETITDLRTAITELQNHVFDRSERKKDAAKKTKRIILF